MKGKMRRIVAALMAFVMVVSLVGFNSSIAKADAT